jgi:hypothetical protein
VRQARIGRGFQEKILVERPETDELNPESRV